MLVDKSEENFVAFPHGQVQKALFLDPLKVTLVAFNLVAGPIGANEDVHVLVVVDVVDEGDDAAITPFRDGEACLLPYLT